MGNQSSSASSASTRSSRKQSKNSKKKIAKSESLGSGFPPSASSTSSEDLSAPREAQSKPQEEKPFHYNVHKSQDFLQVKRHNSALEFVSGKSPLKDFFKLTSRNGNNNLTAIPPDLNKPGNMDRESNIVKLAKLLAEISQSEVPKPGHISENVIQKHVFPHSPLMSSYMWNYLTGGKPVGTISVISDSMFVANSEKIFALHTDKDQLTYYLKVFGIGQDMMERETFVDFLICAYQLATVGEVEHKSSLEMKGYNPFEGKEYFEAVEKSCYHIKNEMSICFLSNWLQTNLPRLHFLMHKYVLHQLTTGYSQLATGNVTINTQGSGVTSVATMSEEKAKEAEASAALEDNDIRPKLDPILIWLLRSSLPSKFLAVFNRRPSASQLRIPGRLTAVNSAQLLQQLVQCVKEPESWSLLYDSESDGLSINRFQHHVFNYKGPTFLVLYCENGYTIGLAADTEWKESCHFWGNEDATLVQIQPEFRVVEKGVKLIYVNFSIRGYPFGIQAGKDPRNVSLDIKPDFGTVLFKKIPCRVLKFTVWGCAAKETQAAQTEYKKWEAKQCENIKKVSLKAVAADWKDNPDKYLLELAGNYRSYNNS